MQSTDGRRLLPRDRRRRALDLPKVRLAKVGDESRVSRSQAKRLMMRVDGVRIVVPDFADVSRIGQAFADEVFRVFANEHPDIELQHVNAPPKVQQRIRRAEVSRDAGGNQMPLR